jgi:phospholipase/carboxylesterase
MLDGPRLSPVSGVRPDALVVLLHGYGSNGDDLISLARWIQPMLPKAAFVAPNAPLALPHMARAYQWWPIQTFSMIERAMAIDAFVSYELAAAGLADDRLLLVGFSQGTMMALHVGLRRLMPAAGIIGFSGMLVAPERLDADMRSRPPVLLVHGTDDDVVPFGSLALAAGALRSGGIDVETHVSPGIGHSIDQAGLSAAAQFAKRVLG